MDAREVIARAVDPQPFTALRGPNWEHALLGAFAKADAILAALAANQLAVVGREPTDEMHNAARDWSNKKYGIPIGFDGSDGCWKSMFDAISPSPVSTGDRR